MSYNETRDIAVTFKVPPYVAPGRRFEVTLDCMTVDEREISSEVSDDYGNYGYEEEEEEEEEEGDGGGGRFQTTFYFTISGNDSQGLGSLDGEEPSCGDPERYSYEGLEECANATAASNCTDGCWGASLAPRDAGAGMGQVRLARESAGNATLSYAGGVVKGTRAGVRVRVESSCCQTSVTVEAEDLAGNVARCRVGRAEESGAGRVGTGWALGFALGVFLTT